MTFSYTLDRENRHLIIEEGTTEIPEAVFSGSYDFDSISLPNSVISIGTQAFYRTSLDEIDLPDSIEVIGNAAFRETEISKIDIPDSVTTLGKQAFYIIFSFLSTSCICLSNSSAKSPINIKYASSSIFRL